MTPMPVDAALKRPDTLPICDDGMSCKKRDLIAALRMVLTTEPGNSASTMNDHSEVHVDSIV